MPPLQRRATRPQVKSQFLVAIGDAVQSSSAIIARPTTGPIQTANGISNLLFTVFEGGAGTVATSTYNDGVSNRVNHVAGLADIEPVTLRKRYVVDVDYIVFDWFNRNQHSQPGFAVSVTPVYYVTGSEEPKVKLDRQKIFLDCILTYCKHPDVDKESSDPSDLELRFQPNFVKEPGGSQQGVGA